MYDYNSKRRKDEIIRDSLSLPIYVRSAYVLQSETPVSEADISEELLLLTPSHEVVEQVHILEAKIAKLQTDLIGVHVRMNILISKKMYLGFKMLRNTALRVSHRWGQLWQREADVTTQVLFHTLMSSTRVIQEHRFLLRVTRHVLY